MNIARKRREAVVTVNAPVMESTEVTKKEKTLTNSVSEARKQLYDTFMANITPFNTDENGKVLTCIGHAPLVLCEIDLSYQGWREHKKIHQLEAEWDLRKVTPIVLVPHPETCSLTIVDGQGRYRVAPKKNLNKLQAVILMDAPTDPEERRKFEAEYFISQDEQCEVVKPIEKHPARVIIGDTTAIIIEKMMKKYAVEATQGSGKRSCSVLGSYTDCYKIAKAHGEECLDFICSIIENAGWNQATNGYARCIMNALKDVFVAHKTQREEIHKFLSKELRQMDPFLFAANGRATYPKREHAAACSLYLEDLICDALHIEKRIYINGNGKKCVVIK